MSIDEPIVIVGRALAVPGATDAETFWSNICANRTEFSAPPPGRWVLAPDPSLSLDGPRPDRVTSITGCFTSAIEPVMLPGFSQAGIDAATLAKLDPMFHMLFQVGSEAWRSANTTQIDPARATVICGNILLPTSACAGLAASFFRELNASPATRDGSASSRLNLQVGGLPAALLARGLGLGGHAFTLDAACASSLYAIRLACQELQHGNADIALAGGMSRADALYTQMGFTQLRALSPRGVATPFDAGADGLVVGEGCAMFVLKRESDAVRDGDQILARIAAVGVSNDIGGRLMAPDQEGQLRAMRAAYNAAGWRPDDVSLFECHGTGTPVGDATEIASLNALWKDAPVDARATISSVKGNIGHLLTGAGAAGLYKTLLALENLTLPPTAGYTRADVSTDLGAFQILNAPRPWPAGKPAKAAVSAFGFGGINAHLLLEAPAHATDGFTPRADTGSTSSHTQPSAVGIVGIGAHFGPWESAPDVLVRLASHEPEAVRPRAPANWFGHSAAAAWPGHYIDSLTVSATRFRVPPMELTDSLPQQLLVLNVAAEALDDAGIETNAPNPRLGVFVGTGLDLNTTNFTARWEAIARGEQPAADGSLTANRTMGALGSIAASRIARAFGAGGPAFTLSDGAKSVSTALELAVRALQREEIDTAIVAGVDFAGDPRTVLMRDGVSDQRSGESPPIGEGGAAFILRRIGDADAAYGLIVTDELPSPGSPVDDAAITARLGTSGDAHGAAVVLEAIRHLTANVPNNSCEPAGQHDRPFSIGPKNRLALARPRLSPAKRPRTADAETSQQDRSAKTLTVANRAATPPLRLAEPSAAPLSSALAVAMQTRRLENEPQREPAGESLSALPFAQGVVTNLSQGPESQHGEPSRRQSENGDLSAILERAALANGEAHRSFLRLSSAISTSLVEVGLQAAHQLSTAPQSQHLAPPSRPPAGAPSGPRYAQHSRPGFAPPAAGSTIQSAQHSAAQHAPVAKWSANSVTTPTPPLAAGPASARTDTAAGSGLAAPNTPNPEPTTPVANAPSPNEVPRALNREACLTFAIGKIGDVLGPTFAPVDNLPSRVRLPDEPLMLVDRITDIDGVALSMSAGRVVTEHDVLPNAWYLDAGRIPTCIAVEAGQADLFLSAFLGADFETAGLGVYRLLDAAVTFDAGLPAAGSTLRYDIRITRFFRLGATLLFRFEFDATADGVPLMRMRDGCAGFFSPSELAAGRGLVEGGLTVESSEERSPLAWDLAHRPETEESYSEAALDALRRGDITACFGPSFGHRPGEAFVPLPENRMRLVHRITSLRATGGRFNAGLVIGEADIQGDEWFLTCHFKDDEVMPGTLMYECCLHTLRVFLLRYGWTSGTGVDPNEPLRFEPVPGVTSRLRCRGQVTEATSSVQYEIHIRSLSYDADGTPIAMADAIMCTDHRPVVHMENLCARLSGTTRTALQAAWRDRPPPSLIFDHEQVLEFAEGRPSRAFGSRYEPFDAKRKLARLPRPPYNFLHGVFATRDCEPWVMKAGGKVGAVYRAPATEWYFDAYDDRTMPYAVLLEIGLQACGWLAAYMGSALVDSVDLAFRNLEGWAEVGPPIVAPTVCDSGGRPTEASAAVPVETRLTLLDVSQAGQMVIQRYAYDVSAQGQTRLRGETTFGFFSQAALANQAGIQGAAPDDRSTERPENLPAPRRTEALNAAVPSGMIRMIDVLDIFEPDGGEHQLGYLRASAEVKAEAWYFHAHFYEDPVCPGSLGLEGFLQVMRIAATHRFGPGYRWTCEPNSVHEWWYRGQIVPTNRAVQIECTVTGWDDAHRTVTADGRVCVDGLVIYAMKSFTIRGDIHEYDAN